MPNTPSLPGELRPGILAQLYYVNTLGGKLPKQADFMDSFFPGLLIEELPSDGKTKEEARFDDQRLIIKAVKYNGRFHIGGERRITQILGRLTGTAKGSQEKERSTAHRMQIRACDDLIADPAYLKYIRDLNTERILKLTDEQQELFVRNLDSYLGSAIEYRTGQSFDERQSELFPIGDEVLEILFTNVGYQWDIGTFESFGNVFTWLLLAALLRDQMPRLNAKYLSTFEPRTPEDADRITKEDLEEGELFYSGDDIDNRFSGVEWYCDRCGEHLNGQPGFDDHAKYWICQKCGYKNPINMDAIYNCEKEYQNGSAPVNREEFFRALKERTEELNQ